MIFLDTNVISETLRKAPDQAVIARLVRYDAGLALSTVTIAEIAFGTQKIRPDQPPSAWSVCKGQPAEVQIRHVALGDVPATIPVANLSAAMAIVSLDSLSGCLPIS